MTDAAHDSKPPGQFYCPTCEKNFATGEVCPDDGTRLVRLKVNDPLLGRVLDGRYTIQEKLGQGGMGAVYRGSQHSVGREVAIKLVTPQLVSDADVIKRFLREAKLASRLSHPNAVAVLDFGQTDDGLFYLVMELVTGRTLDQIVKAEKKLKPERVVRIGMQVCDALEGAHALQIVHRDLKPANIMLLAQGRDLVKVLDFGLAKSLAPDQTSTTMTNAGALLGTPAFMPPELALGQPCDGRADLYSLGCILFLLGSGRLPFVSDSAHELIAMHGTQPAPPMAGVPQQLAEVIDRLLEKDPAKRWQSATETREALEAAIDAHRIMTPVSGVSRVSVDTPSSPLPTAVGVGVPQKMTTPVPGRPSAATPSSGTPTPTGQRRARSSTEMEKLVNSDTMLPAAAVTSAVPVSSSLPAAPKKSRASLMASLAGVIVLGGAALIFLTNKSKTPSQPAPIETKQPEAKQPQPETPPPVKAPPPDVKQPEQVKAPEQTPAMGTTTGTTPNTLPDVTKVVPDTKLPDLTKVIPEVTVNKGTPDKTAKTTPDKTAKTTPDKTAKTTKTTKTSPDKTAKATPDKTAKTSPDKTTPDKTTPDKTPPANTGSAAKLPF